MQESYFHDFESDGLENFGIILADMYIGLTKANFLKVPIQKGKLSKLVVTN